MKHYSIQLHHYQNKHIFLFFSDRLFLINDNNFGALDCIILSSGNRFLYIRKIHFPKCVLFFANVKFIYVYIPRTCRWYEGGKKRNKICMTSLGDSSRCFEEIKFCYLWKMMERKSNLVLFNYQTLATFTFFGLSDIYDVTHRKISFSISLVISFYQIGM